MSEEKRSYCSRGERGLAPCGQQCGECQSAERGNGHGGDPSPLTPSEQERVAPQEAPPAADAGPTVVHEITIRVYSDGNVQVNGPFHDRIAFAGLLYLAADAERMQFQAAARQRVAAVRGQPHRTITDKVRRFFKR